MRQLHKTAKARIRDATGLLPRNLENKESENSAFLDLWLGPYDIARDLNHCGLGG